MAGNPQFLSLTATYCLDRSPYEEDEKPTSVDIDIALSAYGNARKYYDQKRLASTKEQKTLDSSGKALKSAEKKTKMALKEMKVTANIIKSRKVGTVI